MSGWIHYGVFFSAQETNQPTKQGSGHRKRKLECVSLSERSLSDETTYCVIPTVGRYRKERPWERQTMGTVEQ